jgi:lipoyl(octanoyl) transferase
MWHLWLDDTPRPGWRNMALDLALLERSGRTGESWLRLYQWSPHCLSFGRHEPATRRYDRGRIGSLGLDLVRRPTGGRAVWHGRELTYAIAMPSRELGDLREAYLAIHGMLANALRRLGADAGLAPRSEPTGVGAGACFARPAGGEVLVQGRKVVGSAQLREGDALLQHGSILLEDDQSLVGEVTRGSPPPDLAAPLAELLDRPIPAAEVAEAVAGAAAEGWGGEWKRVKADEALHAEAAVHEPRFRSEEWTWRI